MREGCEVFAIDTNAQAVEHARRLVTSLGNPSPAENFRVAAVEQMPFHGTFADVVICTRSGLII